MEPSLISTKTAPLSLSIPGFATSVVNPILLRDLASWICPQRLISGSNSWIDFKIPWLPTCSPLETLSASVLNGGAWVAKILTLGTWLLYT